MCPVITVIKSALVNSIQFNSIQLTYRGMLASSRIIFATNTVSLVFCLHQLLFFHPLASYDGLLTAPHMGVKGEGEGEGEDGQSVPHPFILIQMG